MKNVYGALLSPIGGICWIELLFAPTPCSPQKLCRELSCLCRVCNESAHSEGEWVVGTIVLIVVLIFLLGGCGYYGHSRYGGAGLGGVLGLVLIIVLVLWLLGGLGRVQI